jgi:tetratricopeptide (TPR) repeat protein
MRLYVAALLLVCPLAAANDWVRISSRNFEMYTNAGEKDARKTIEYFEQVRDFFMRTKSSEVTTRLPVTIVGFRGPKDYKPYAASASAAAYYVGDENRDYIVMGSVGEEDFPIATHEYMHLLVRHTEMKLPVWLNEGIAEVYSSLKPRANKIMIGDVLPGRAQLLAREKWLSIESLLSVRPDSPEYNEKNRSGILYAQSWLLSHMLMLDNSYAPNFSKFLETVSGTKSSAKAFEVAYGKTLADVGKDLQSYYRSNGVRVGLFDAKFEKMQSSDPEPATDTQVGVLLARLTAMLRRYDEAESRLKSLAAKSPDNAEIHEALGHLYWRKNDKTLAREHLGRAVQLNAPSWKTYWDFARLAQDAPAGDKEVVAALEKAVGMNPALTDAQMMLGYRYYLGERHGQALVTLRQITRVTPELAPRLFLLKAFVNIKLKDHEQAKKDALQARKYATLPEDIKQSDDILAFLERPGRFTVAEADVAANDRPRLERRPAPATTWDVPPAEPQEQLASLQGVLTQIQCLDGQAKLIVASGNKSVAFLIRDSTRVYIKGAKQDEQLLTCGPARRPVAIEYLPNDDRVTGTVGEARVIDYGPR